MSGPGRVVSFRTPLLNATFNNISIISCKAFFLNILVEKAGKKNTKKSTYAISAYHQ
jgi:hypothetical protein